MTCSIVCVLRLFTRPAFSCYVHAGWVRSAVFAQSLAHGTYMSYAVMPFRQVAGIFGPRRHQEVEVGAVALRGNNDPPFAFVSSV